MNKSVQYRKLEAVKNEFEAMAQQMADEMPRGAGGDINYGGFEFKEWQYVTYAIRDLNRALAQLYPVTADRRGVISQQ